MTLQSITEQVEQLSLADQLKLLELLARRIRENLSTPQSPKPDPAEERGANPS